MEKEKKDPKEIAKGCGVFIAIGIIIWAVYMVGCSGDEKPTIVEGTTEIESEYKNYPSLEVGKTYSISKQTPFSPELNPLNPLAAIDKMVDMSANSRITIIAIKDKNNTPWYNVSAFDKDNNLIGVGWVNSIALIGQELRLIE